MNYTGTVSRQDTESDAASSTRMMKEVQLEGKDSKDKAVLYTSTSHGTIAHSEANEYSEGLELDKTNSIATQLDTILEDDAIPKEESKSTIVESNHDIDPLVQAIKDPKQIMKSVTGLITRLASKLDEGEDISESTELHELCYLQDGLQHVCTKIETFLEGITSFFMEYQGWK